MNDIFQRVFFSCNANIHALNIRKCMLIACEKNNISLVKFLINLGFDINNNTVNKRTPLFVACEKSHIDLAIYLT